MIVISTTSRLGGHCGSLWSRHLIRGEKDSVEEVTIWPSPEGCVLEASSSSVWPVWEWEYIFKVHEKLIQKGKEA